MDSGMGSPRVAEGRFLLPGTGRPVNNLRPEHPRKDDLLSTQALDLTPQDSLVAIMIAISVSDETIRTAELVTIERIVNHLPVFAEYDIERLRRVSDFIFDLFTREDGLDVLFQRIREALPNGSSRPPMRSPATWPRPTAGCARPNCGFWRKCATNSTSTGSTPPPSSAAPAPVISPV